MIRINQAMRKVEAWSKTTEGKVKMENAIERLVKEGRTKTAAGSPLIDEDVVDRACTKFREVLLYCARDADVAESVIEHLDYLDFGKPIATPDGWKVAVYWDGDLHRDSVQPEHYDGVENIVAILNNGYHAKHSVFGTWESRGVDIWSRTNREGLHFIEQAVSDFNGNYGADFNVTAIAAKDYTS